MVDSDNEQVFSPAGQRDEGRNWVPMAAGAAVVLAMIGAFVLLGRSGRSDANVKAGDPYLAKMQVYGLHMATAQNFAGSSVTYIEGKIANSGDRKVTAARVEVLFKNSLGEIAQKEVLAVTVLLPNVPYVDYGTIDQAPLAPAQARDFRLTLEHVSTDWDGQIPQVKVVSVSY
jgi:hypothetical protein